MRPGVHHIYLASDASLLVLFGHPGGLEFGDEDGIVVSTEPQGGLPVGFLDDVPDPFSETTGSPLHVGTLFVPIQEPGSVAMGCCMVVHQLSN